MSVGLTVAAAQPKLRTGNVVGNAERHAEAVRRARARVVVFPEMSLTGYDLTAEPIAPTDERLVPIVAACRETGAVALVGCPVAAAGGRSIGMMAVDGERARIVYRKVCLGDTEQPYMTPGTDPAVIEVDGWMLGLAICRDTGVAGHAAATAAMGMDVYVAGMLEHATAVDELLARARCVAFDHDVGVVFSSFAGSTSGGFDRAAGRSGLWSADGVCVQRAGAAADEIVRHRFRHRHVWSAAGPWGQPGRDFGTYMGGL